MTYIYKKLLVISYFVILTDFLKLNVNKINTSYLILFCIFMYINTKCKTSFEREQHFLAI